MKAKRILISSIMFSFALAAAVPAFAQRGIGVGVGSQTGVNVGRGAGVGVGTQTGVGVQAGGAKVGVGTDADVQVQKSGQAKGGPVQSESNASLAARIERDPQLAARVQSMLPSGSSISSASAGFRNQGQFLAALHASQNLNIPFDQLKTKVTGSNAVSLGSAIKASKPDMSDSEAKDEAKKAEAEAKASAAAKVSSRQ